MNLIFVTTAYYNTSSFLNKVQVRDGQHDEYHTAIMALFPILGMENQGPHLNTLPRRNLVTGVRVHKRTMRHGPRAPDRLAIKTLDQQRILGLQLRLVKPLVRRVIPHCVRLSLSSRVDKRDWYEVGVRNGVRVGHGKGVAKNGLYGAPDVYDLNATGQELLCLVGEVVRDARECGGEGLVDVDALDGPTEVFGLCVGGWAADCVVENEDL